MVYVKIHFPKFKVVKDCFMDVCMAPTFPTKNIFWKKSPIWKISRKIILHNNNAEKLFTN